MSNLNLPVLVLLLICISCLFFILWRRADRLRGVASHQLETWSTAQVRLSEDDGPAATEFLADDETPVTPVWTDFPPQRADGHLSNDRDYFPSSGDSESQSHLSVPV
ncbi:hypothetical protein F5141DRAFT_605737 [Pisolithus sp. B1]|nr:hypothetical protein F5141DRAFT_605737 [Pisolithus sp. B1]